MSLENISSLLLAEMSLEELSEQLPSMNKATAAAVALVGLVAYKAYDHYSSVVCATEILMPDKSAF